MSASTERKNRQAARAAGTDKKMLAAQQAAENKKKSKRRWTIGTIAVAVLIALILFLDSGFLFTHTTALSIGDEKYTPAEVSFQYASSYYTMLNQYGSYASLFGLSGGIGSLGNSQSMFGEGTWKEYFLDQAVTTLTQTKALTDYAAANGISLDEEELASVEDQVAQLEETAKANGYKSADNLLGANYGNGVTLAVMRQATTDTTLAAKAYTTYRDGLSYTSEQLEEEYQSYNGDSDIFSFMLYTLTAAVEEGAEGPTEEALTETHADAEAVSMAFTDGDDIDDVQERFNAAVDSQFEGQVPALRQNVAGSSLGADYKEWMLEEGREEGDVFVADTSTGSVVVVFLSRSDNHYATVNVRHILVMAEADEEGNYSEEALAAARERAEEILAEWEAGERRRRALPRWRRSIPRTAAPTRTAACMRTSLTAGESTNSTPSASAATSRATPASYTATMAVMPATT